jgi:hypothetical protein
MLADNLVVVVASLSGSGAASEVHGAAALPFVLLAWDLGDGKIRYSTRSDGSWLKWWDESLIILA